MNTTRTSDAPAPDAPAWTGDVSDYDAWFDEPWGRYAFAVESAAIRRAAGDLARTRVLDAGCGTGRFSAAIAGGGATAVVGVDADADMLRVAQPRATAGCVRSVVEHLPFPNESFDLTLAMTVLEFVADPAAALAERARVTRVGGRIVIGALNPRSPWGLANRRRLSSGVWCNARFLSRSQLRQLATPHGPAVVHGALYAPGALPGLAVIGPLLETARCLAPGAGAFQVLAIDKARP